MINIDAYLFMAFSDLTCHPEGTGIDICKFKACRISSPIFGLTLSFLSNRQLQMVPEGKSSQEHPVNAGVPQGSILILHFSTIH